MKLSQKSVRWSHTSLLWDKDTFYPIISTVLTHYTAQRCRSETQKFILEDLFSSVLSQFRKYHSSENPKFINSGIFQSLKFRILMEEILSISLLS